ncbi:MAG: hypothetical protein DRQ13_01075 [Ignavibacteriae bacterium]|nr:MAG: hypothetical protein DRQ13_01075 [Ignavibacteriota bacterium]
MKNFIYLLLISLFLIVELFGQQQVESKHSQLKIDCKTCHACQVPTKDDPCLIACPRFKMTKTYPSPESSPNVIVIKELEDRYEPVVFSHRLHAQMSKISGGCETCHHYNTLGPILSCNECHSKERKREDVRTPDLKAAYHQQCLDCHRQWSHQTECISCHKPKKEGIEFNVQQKTSEFVDEFHPKIIEPGKIVFETDYKKGKFVTFYHNEHTTLFGFECIDCHKDESCLRCHDVKKSGNKEVTFYQHPVKIHLEKEEHHKKCMKCHEENNCSFCHKDKVSGTYNHALRTGWTLNRFHQELSCTQCHKPGNQFAKLPTDCNSCHSDWRPDTFNHKVTGLILDENHKDNDCADCHIDRDFSVNPTCDDCHDDKNYPEEIPGKLIAIN